MIYIQENINTTTRDGKHIFHIFKISRTTLCKYLKINDE